MKIALLLFLCCLVYGFAFAQEQAKERAEVTSLHKIHFFNPAYEWEGRLAPRLTLLLNAGIGFGFRGYFTVNSGGPDHRVTFAVLPQGRAAFRYYYDLEKRARAGRSVRGNSGSFVSAGVLYRANPLLTIGPDREFARGAIFTAWGLQRTFKNNMNFELSVGLSYAPGREPGERPIFPVLPFSQFKLGYVFLRD